MQFPQLSVHFGERLEASLPAFLASFTMHALLLVGLAFVGYRAREQSRQEFQSNLAESVISASDSTYQDLDQTADPPGQTPKAGSFAPTLLPTITLAPSSVGITPRSPVSETSAGAA